MRRGGVAVSRADLAQASRRNGWHSARQVLAVRLDDTSDVLMTSPALAAIRDSLPGARLTLLASPRGTALAPHLPMVDEAIEHVAAWLDPAGGDEEEVGRTERELVEILQCRRFDAAVIFTPSGQSALPAAMLCRLAGIPLRLAHCRDDPGALLSDWVRDSDGAASGTRH